jgi:cyclopropane-fatty-acyl-phospholipid synthase
MLGLLLNQLIREGTLSVIYPDGGRKSFGDGAPRVTMRLIGRRTAFFLGLRPELEFGRAYMDGRLVMEEGGIADLLQLLIANLGSVQHRTPAVIRMARHFRRWLRALHQLNRTGRARKNVAHHYDLSGELYELFLDSDRQYSCGYFRSPRDSLETAQIAKKRHIEAKLHLDRKGLQVLDIGSGWGGLALDLARHSGAEVLGITLSSEQLDAARARAKSAGLSDHCRFELMDYRDLSGKFDRIVSVGMFEHVGVNYYDAYFAKLASLLNEDGVALLHTIGRLDGPGATNPFIKRYIFPGGYVPALSEILPAIERSGLMVTDVEVLRRHYAETLRIWRQRFRRNWAKAAALYDERFCRMWEFYLAACEMTFRHDGQAVFQIQLAKRNAELPVTRDYMFEAERAMRFAGRTNEAA